MVRVSAVLDLVRIGCLRWGIENTLTRRRDTSLLLGGTAAVALLIRIWFPYHDVFGGSFVRFAGTDPWYHMRLVENLLHHFPHRIWYDPYRLFGRGDAVNIAPLFDLIIAAAALVLGAGHPSAALVEHVGAYAPAVLGAACVFPAYLLGQILFSRRAGLLAAAITALLPGQFLARSSLGYTDHHVAEVLFSACTLAFFVGAIRTERLGEGIRPRTPAIVAGLFLGAYLDSWTGGALLVMILAAACAIAIAIRPAHRAEVDAIATSFAVACAVAALLVAPFAMPWVGARSDLAMLAAAVVGVLVLAGLARVLTAARLPAWTMIAIGAAVSAAAVVLFLWMAPSAGELVRGQIERLGARGEPRVAEAMPLLSIPPAAPLFAFVQFGFCFYLALVGAVWVARTADSGRIVLLTMFVVAIGLTFRQVRFAYYVAIPAAVLAAWVCDRLMMRARPRAGLALVAVVLLVLVPEALLARTASIGSAGPSDDWHEALTWLRANSPEPFGAADVFDADYAGLSLEHPYPLLPSSYAVTSWWPNGYWIIRIARRSPNANPSELGAARVASVLTAPDEDAASTALARLRSRYVIVDDAIAPRWTGKGVAGTMEDALRTAGLNPDIYYGVYYQRAADGGMRQTLLYYPRYYQSLGVRLAAFDGRAAQPRNVSVVLFHQEHDASGAPRNMLDRFLSFPSFAAAKAFILTSTHMARIVGTDPRVPCLPVPALQTLTLVHTAPGGTVRIFRFQQP